MDDRVNWPALGNIGDTNYHPVRVVVLDEI